jgi:hypothetical protein
MDGQPVSSYTCTDCMDKWLDEINGDEEEWWHNIIHLRIKMAVLVESKKEYIVRKC